MADNKLNLLVKFTGVDKLSGSIRNIMGASKGGTASLRDMQREVRLMEKDLKRVNREMAQGGNSNGGLAMAQRMLTESIAETNGQIDRQKAKLERSANVQARMGKVADVTGRAGAAMSLAVTAPMGAFVASSIAASRDAAGAVAQVDASLASMGGASKRNMAQLQEQAGKLMNVSLFDDDEIMRKVTANMLTFGKVSGATFDRAQLAAVNMATKLDGDLQGATMQVGKALNDPVKGVTALSRAGVSFTAAQKDMIQSMVNAGNVAGAQNIILSEMDKQFGKSGEAARAADPGGALAISFGELQQTVGDKLLPVLTPFVVKITELIDRFSNLPGPVQNVILGGAALLAVAGPLLLGISGIVTAVSGVIAIAPALGAAFTLMTGPVGLVIAAVAALAYAIYANWDTIKAAFNTGIAWIKGVFNALPAWMKSIGAMMMQGLLISLNPALLVAKLIGIAKSGVTAFKNYFGIKSPSRLFMEMGGHINDGLGIGLERGQSRPVRAVGKMAGAVAGAGALALSPAASARAPAAPGGKVEINVYQQPGESGEELAARVARLLENARRGGRSYQDDF